MTKPYLRLGRPHHTSRARAGKPSKRFERYCAGEGTDDPEYGNRLNRGFKIIWKAYYEEDSSPVFHVCANWDEWTY